MEALFKDIFTFLLENYALYLVIVMSITTALIVFLLNIIKKPFKKLSSKIKNERVRKLVNRIFIFFFSFAFAFGLWFFLSVIAPQYFSIEVIVIILNGALPIVSYAFTEGWISKEKAKSIIKNVVDSGSDGTITKDELSKTAQDVSSIIDPEQELQKLLKK